jgi:hypothetical protein
MDHTKSTDPYYQIIAALLVDLQKSHSLVFTPRSLRLTTRKVASRCEREGLGFLTKTLPRLGKAFQRALTGEVPLNSMSLAFDSLPDSKLPRFLGELFQRIFDNDGWVLPTPCVISIKWVVRLCFVFYKLKLGYSADQEQKVIDKFLQTEDDLLPYNEKFGLAADYFSNKLSGEWKINPPDIDRVVWNARRLLARVFWKFDPTDIIPHHGPGAVAQKQKLWDKYTWSSISPRIVQTFPLDAYFYASLGHVCDQFDSFEKVEFRENSARVCLVEKDSRGPRLISCEPKEFQWVQQGLKDAIVRHVECHPLTRSNIHFTDQQPNRFGALLGSSTGQYATLDLNEASDRVTVGLVRLLFPEPLLGALLASRSLSTILPNGSVKTLCKYAPMGSALCFPVLALTIWSLLQAAELVYNEDSDLESLLVYGDDVIVKTARAEQAMRILESFGLKINRDKSCVSGLFRESCGMDAYGGIPITPVRIRTLWTSHRCPDVYTAWISYANAYYKQGCYSTYDTIVQLLLDVYREIPDDTCGLSVPHLVAVPEVHLPKRQRNTSKNQRSHENDYQRLEWHVWDVGSRRVLHAMDGWSMLLRFFTEHRKTSTRVSDNNNNDTSQKRLSEETLNDESPFSVRTYTERKQSKLRKRWSGRTISAKYDYLERGSFYRQENCLNPLSRD